MEVLPWILCAGALLVLLVMVCLDSSKRRRPSDGAMLRRGRASAASTRDAIRAATRGKLAELDKALDEDDPAAAIARLANDAAEDRP